MLPVPVALVVFTLTIQDSQATRADCQEWHECRQQALDAAERQDYERFHDLAWRAVQTGPKNDPALMYLLARAQSLSGRPGDALVMLQRLVRMGSKTDAATSDDFRRVRALPAWAELEAGSDRAAAATPSTSTPIAPRESAADPLKAPVPTATAKPAAVPRAAATGVAPVESLRFTASAATPAGLAYDAVSRRFIVGDRDARKLTVVDEFSQHVANLASAQSAGFGNIAALEIDPRQGNLWVVSTDKASGDGPTTGEAAAGRTTLHKLQLISGRVLQSFTVPEPAGSARFADVAVAPDSTVLVLDDSGQRVFRLRAKATDLEIVATLTERPSSIAPGPEGLVYAAMPATIVAIETSSKTPAPLKAPSGVDLARISRLRWHKGSLVGIQQNGSSYRAIRLTLDPSGRRVTRQQILDESLPTIDPSAATISGGVLYYLASDGTDMVIRKITLP